MNEPTMNEPTLTATELITWVENTSAGWQKLLYAHPDLLLAPCDIMGVKTVAELLQHIVAVELRYAEQLAGLPATDYARISFDSVEAIYATHDRAIALLEQLLATDLDWNASIEYMTRSMGPAARPAGLFSFICCFTASATTRSSPPSCAGTASNPTGPWTISLWTSLASSAGRESPQSGN